MSLAPCWRPVLNATTPSLYARRHKRTAAYARRLPNLHRRRKGEEHRLDGFDAPSSRMRFSRLLFADDETALENRRTGDLPYVASKPYVQERRARLDFIEKQKYS